MLNIAFMGTPDFAVPSLAAIKSAGHDVAVFTQPDKPVGRGNRVAMPAVKAYALKNNIQVYQFALIKSAEGVNALRALAPDLMVTAAFGQILSAEVLKIPRLGCINVHGSLLPKYRGAAPIQWAIINGEAETGITTMFTDAGLDTGDMLLRRSEPILPSDTAESLFQRLSQVGAEVLLETLERLQAGTLIRAKQNGAESSYYPMIKKSMAAIDFNKTAEQLDCFVRGMYSWPVAYTCLEEGVFKIHKAHPVKGSAPAGLVVHASPENGFVFGCLQGLLAADIIQAPGGKAMSAADYLRGHSVREGQTAGSEDADDKRQA